MQKKIILIAGVLLTLTVSFVLFKLLYNDVYPLGALALTYDNSSIKLKAVELLNQEGIDLSDKVIDTKLKRNSRLEQSLQLKYGIEETNQYAKDKVPVHYWNIRIQGKDEDKNILITADGAKDNLENEKKDFYLNFDANGNLLDYVNPISDSLELEQLEIDDARREAELFINKYAPSIKLIPDSSYLKLLDQTSAKRDEIFIFKEQHEIKKPLRTDFSFVWVAESAVTDNKITLTVEFAGRNVIKYITAHDVIPDSPQGINYITTVTAILFMIIITVLIIITAYRRIKEFELGFKIALWVGLLYAISFGFNLYSEVNFELEWEMLFPLIFGGLLLGGVAVITWSISESVTRDVWKEKLINFDLFVNGHLLNSRLSESILRGIQFGTAIAAFWLILLFITANITDFVFIQKDDKDLVLFHSIIPSFTLLNNAIFSHLLIIPTFFMFTLSGLRKRISNDILLLIVCGIIWGLINDSNIKPIYLGIILETAIGIILAYIFYKYDIITIIITLFTMFPLLGGFVFLNLDGEIYNQTELILISIYALIIVIAITGYLTSDRITDLDSITPVFVKNINERQRMQRELEIARDVQMSFLPKTYPDFKGLDIAAKCYPALEVGGDYYDFVRISENKLGVIIGDVSGKGAQAAFYMTLTKGFLKAISKTSDSPSEVLRLMNELFYDNVERGTFISMIYGVFDREKKIFKLARAGHNPVIVRNSSAGRVEMLNPTGLALGLEKGVLFRKTISEIEIKYSRDDVFVFYTDGFTEAMNKMQEEFSEERLLESVQKLAGLNSQESINKIHNEVREFIGKTPQHDDMTIVVIKVADN